MRKQSDPNNNNNYAIFVVFLVGGMLMLFQFVKNIPVYVEGALAFPQSPITFHSKIYDGLLTKYVKDGLVDYAALKNSSELRDAVDELKHTSPDKLVAEDDQMAYWVNAYNLLVLKMIADRYPIRTINQIGNDYSGKMFVVGGRPYAVQDIYIGQIFPRAKQSHETDIFLVSQGAIGYPPLQTHGFDKDNLATDAEAAAHAFINDPRNVLYDPDSKALKLSKFFQWTQDVYGGKWDTPFVMVDSYLDKKVDLRLEGLTQAYSLPFDWRLNDSKLRAAK
ncbi:MAG TPA: DUF547 domain-containing protein [Planktothrix sp.]